MSYKVTIDVSKEEIIHLRMLSFEREYGEKVSISGLNWTHIDRNSLHLGIYNGLELIGCLRLSVFKDIDLLNSVTQIPLTEVETKPYALLSRAATHPNYLNRGVHSILRLHALTICFENKLFSIFGSLEKKSSRLSQLQEIGYEIINEIDKWPNSYLKNDGNVVLIRLKGEQKISHAIEQLKNKLSVGNLKIQIPKIPRI